MNLDDLVMKLAGFRVNDIKYICDRAATIPFLCSVSDGEEGDINAATLFEVIAETHRSVFRRIAQPI